MVSVVVKMNRILTFLILTIVFCSIVLIVVFTFKSKKNYSPEKYLESLGYEIEYISDKEVNIPENFGDELKKYNKMQKEQGFNLEKYRGINCIQKQYYVTCDRIRPKKYIANILTYKNKIIGGDLHSGNFEEKVLKLNDLKHLKI